MREVAVSRFVRATPAEVRRSLTPEALVAYEGSFAVRDVVDRDGATVVTAGAHGLELTLRFERRDDGLYYEHEGPAGPFDAMETRVTVTAENEGSRVAVRSWVSLGLPVASVTDRVAAWKRRGELRRALDALEADVS